MVSRSRSVPTSLFQPCLDMSFNQRNRHCKFRFLSEQEVFSQPPFAARLEPYCLKHTDTVRLKCGRSYMVSLGYRLFSYRMRDDVSKQWSEKRWIRRMMGGNDSKYISESELSDSESSVSDEYESPSEQIDEPTVDAALRVPISLPRAQDVLNLDKLLEIENRLEIDEIISLAFLLLDENLCETECCLQDLTLILEGSTKKLLYDWAAVQDMRGNNWQNKFIESLCIIKNYEVLKSLGYQKSHAKDHYLPHFNSSLHINEIRKTAYLICEKLSSKKTATFLEHVRRKFNEKKMAFDEYDPQFLELFFLKWETTSTFSLTDVRSILKIMDEEELYTMLDNVLIRHNNVQKVKEPFEPIASIRFESVQGSSKSDCAYQNSQTCRNDFFEAHYQTSGKTSRDRTCSSTTSMDNPVPQEYVDSNYTFMDYQLPHVGLAHSNMSSNDNRYDIDPNKPGVVLIINQESFYTDIHQEYKDLLPPDTREQLVSRKGTEKDKEELQRVFTRFGFRVLVAENLNHIDMVRKIKDVINGIEDESSLFICILSHGDKGVVYGANSCMVKINKIQEIMHKVNKNKLAGKPKVLILQSCQGQECQKLEESEEECDQDHISLTTDGPAPLLRDMITFYASIPGYAAIRSKKTGSWFIQALCNQMIQVGNRFHFADICTRTAHEVTKQVWLKDKDKKAMTPLLESTLLKAFYLPPMRKIDESQ
ncbi:unnamed protein product [Phaedon cochleariae]|uniref:Peptidase C14A caspase catalytic domain-containing protein n=1 Tax=Phaedon cochleariae TaxID=80249 RepID=A0A9P0GQ73_PHACE|nr:unnamed protein product [Phaedon cochleariae]